MYTALLTFPPPLPAACEYARWRGLTEEGGGAGDGTQKIGRRETAAKAGECFTGKHNNWRAGTSQY